MSSDPHPPRSYLRRSREEIEAAILKSCVSDKLTLSQLMVIQNLSYTLLKTYLAKLVSAGLLEYEEQQRKRYVWTTARGITVLKCYRNALALLNGYPSSCPLLIELSEHRRESEMLATD